MRSEKDPLGKKKVPSDALFGIHTQRAFENFQISGQTLPTGIFYAIADIKQACALANKELKMLDAKRCGAIVRAAKEVTKGVHDGHFVIDAFQAGAGTPTHMNVNEVLANRANELLGSRRGVYKPVHPNDHVNMGQSTNNVVPSAIKLAAMMLLPKLLEAIGETQRAFAKKAREHHKTLKAGRTHLQDAVPVTLGQEFGAYAVCLGEHLKEVKRAKERLLILNVGKNAVGTGINTKKNFTKTVINQLKSITGIPFKPAEDGVHRTQFHTDFLIVHQTLDALAVDLVKIANDLRLLSSGPSTGLGEIVLPAVEPGSSIMPGKVNPSMAEMLNMVCFQVQGNHQSIRLAVQSGQLELNFCAPLIAKNLLESMIILSNALESFTRRCVKGIKADKAVCKDHFERSIGLATLLNPHLGYDAAAELAKESLKKKTSIPELAIKKGLLTEAEAKRLFSESNVTSPNR